MSYFIASKISDKNNKLLHGFKKTHIWSIDFREQCQDHYFSKLFWEKLKFTCNIIKLDPYLILHIKEN